jgi:Na+-driven multidrug efflux pump
VLWPTLITFFCIAGIQIPAAWALSDSFGISGIWAAYPIAFLTMLGLQTSYYRLVWKKKAIKRL